MSPHSLTKILYYILYEILYFHNFKYLVTGLSPPKSLRTAQILIILHRLFQESLCIVYMRYIYIIEVYNHLKYVKSYDYSNHLKYQINQLKYIIYLE